MATPKQSCGLLMYRRCAGELQVFIAHPGGPYFARKDEGVWSIPKGELGAGEDPLACAKREFLEETGLAPEAPEFIALGSIVQRAGKVVHAWAFEGEWDERTLHCNTFEMEWPPRSGKRQSFPEIDRAQFFSEPEARQKLIPAQVELIDRLIAHLR